MRLAVSNIAWTTDQRIEAYAIMREHGIFGLEIAPGIFFDGADDTLAPSPSLLTQTLREIHDAGLTLVSMQSLLFGVSHAALFGSQAHREAFFTGMSRAISLAGLCGIPNLVFGSPTQRIVPDDMARDLAVATALDVFQLLGDRAIAAGTRISIEFNPSAYGTNFLNTLDEVLSFVEDASHPAIQLCFDIGALQMNGGLSSALEGLPVTVAQVGHVHMSEPYLAPAPANTRQAEVVLHALLGAKYPHWVSVEMRASADGSLGALDAALGRLTSAAAAVEVVFR